MSRRGRKISRAEFMADMEWHFAIRDWRRYKDSTRVRRLQAQGVKSDIAREFLEGRVRRPRGAPAKLKMGDEDVVELVFKQKLQAGKPFSNQPDPYWNPCFVGVADAWGVNVNAVRRKFKAVPAARRREIHDWLWRVLEAHGELHPRHRAGR